MKLWMSARDPSCWLVRARKRVALVAPVFVVFPSAGEARERGNDRQSGPEIALFGKGVGGKMRAVHRGRVKAGGWLCSVEALHTVPNFRMAP